MKDIQKIARKLKIPKDNLIPYGRFIAKVDYSKEKIRGIKPDGKLVVVTSMTPTKAGEGKTCTAIGLVQALGKLKKNVSLCLREPSLGPIFGIKGGATGNGKAQVLPAEEINLHFTGDMHAVTSSHNLLASLIDNHIVKGNKLNINPREILWNRALDINDRELRYVTLGLKKKSKALKRTTGFIITAASEIMAILGLVEDIDSLRYKLNNILIAHNFNNEPVICKGLNVTGSLLVLLKNALNPNLVQTSEGQPVLIHTGPFANIAHGNNSIIATKLALSRSDIVVTESGFGSDLGMEKLFDIVLPQFNLKPSAVVIVVSVRALKKHGWESGGGKNSLVKLEKGMANLIQHINIVKAFGIKPVIAINKFPGDNNEELNIIKKYCSELGVDSAISQVVSKGSEGGIELAEKVILNIGQEVNFKNIYNNRESIKNKIEKIAKKIYKADGVKYSNNALSDIEFLNKYNLSKLPVNIAKTQLSLTHNSKIKGAPSNWKLYVSRIKPARGANFLVVYTGNIRLMPGLPEHPAAESMNVTKSEKVKGLF